MTSNQYNKGRFETIKFESRHEPYYKGINKIKSMDYTIDDLYSIIHVSQAI